MRGEEVVSPVTVLRRCDHCELTHSKEPGTQLVARTLQLQQPLQHISDPCQLRQPS